jgi:hypothetical protein
MGTGTVAAGGGGVTARRGAGPTSHLKIWRKFVAAKRRRSQQAHLKKKNVRGGKEEEEATCVLIGLFTCMSRSVYMH